MSKKNMTPPLNDESHENKLISLALAQAESQLLDKTASSQVVVHFLRLGSIKAQVELEKLKRESQLLEAKIQSEKSGQQLTEMIGEVIAALRSYSYVPPGDNDADLF